MIRSISRKRGRIALRINGDSVSRYKRKPKPSPKIMNTLTVPLLNGIENSEVINPHKAQNRISVAITLPFFGAPSARVSHSRSYRNPKQAPTTGDQRK